MRRQPVAFALIDAAFLADSKWRALRRRLPEPRDFNSAIGAWLVVLTAARRNGLPNVDAAEEAEDQTFLADLVAVGLLTETGIPDKPFRAWAPARPKYPSDLTPPAPPLSAPPTPPNGRPTYPSDLVSRSHHAPTAPNVTNAPFPPLARASTPITSLPLHSIEDGASRAPAREGPERDPEKGGAAPTDRGIEGTRRQAVKIVATAAAPGGSLAERAGIDRATLAGWKVVDEP